MVFRAWRQIPSPGKRVDPPRVRFPSGHALFCLFPLAVSVLATAITKNACGEFDDVAALRQVKTVCVDASHLDAATASVVRTFVANETQPDRLLSRLNWDFAGSCAKADAILRVYLSTRERYETQPAPRTGPNDQLSSLGYNEPATAIVLLIYDRASLRLLYRSENQVAGNVRIGQLKGPFVKLLKNLEKSP